MLAECSGSFGVSGFENHLQIQDCVEIQKVLPSIEQIIPVQSQ